MSNNASLNSYGVGSSYLDEDARLVGGLGSASAVASALILGIILQGGVQETWQTNPNQYTYPFIGGVSSGSNAYGNIAALAIGGVDGHGGVVNGGIGIGIPAEFASSSEIGSNSWRMSPGTGGFEQVNKLYGKLYIPLTLWSGIGSNAYLGGDLYWKDGLYGGIGSYGDLSSTLVTDHILSAVLNSYAEFDAKVYIAAELDGGLSSDTEVQALHHKNAILQGGIDNPPTVGGVITPANQALVSGVHTSTVVEAQSLREQTLTGGFVVYDSLGGEMEVHIYLREGMVTVGEFEAGLVATVDLEGGVWSENVIESTFITSTVRSGGMHKSSAVGGALRSSPMLFGGLGGSSTLYGNYKRINNVASGGMSSTSEMNARILSAPKLEGGISKSSKVEGFFFKSIKMQGGIGNSSQASAKLVTAVKLQQGAATTSTISGSIVLDIVLQGDYNSTNSGLHALYNTPLYGGLYSGWELTTTDISAYNGDMLHNTWQLEIASVTDILYIETPLGDS